MPYPLVEPCLQHFPVVCSCGPTSFFQFLRCARLLSDSKPLLNIVSFPLKVPCSQPNLNFILYSFFKIHYKCQSFMKTFTDHLSYNPVNSSNNGSCDLLLFFSRWLVYESIVLGWSPGWEYKSGVIYVVFKWYSKTGG